MIRTRAWTRRGARACGCFLALLVSGTVLDDSDAFAADSATRLATVTVTRAQPPTRIYAGMWSSHVLSPGSRVDANGLIAVSFRGYFGGTFVNSYGERAISAGIQRSFTRPNTKALTTSLGYRIGLITGYDDRLFGIGGKVPAVPFVQLLGNLDYRNVGLEIGYAGVVTSIAANWRF
jgi:hypothetical protein